MNYTIYVKRVVLKLTIPFSVHMLLGKWQKTNFSYIKKIDKLFNSPRDILLLDFSV